MKIGERIREFRKQAGLTQKELGERMGVSNVNIGQYERGLRNPRLPQLKKIADALNIPFDLLVSDKVDELVDASRKMNALDIFTQTEFEEKLEHIHYNLVAENDTFICYTDTNSTISMSEDDIKRIDAQVDQYLRFLLDDLSRSRKT